MSRRSILVADTDLQGHKIPLSVLSLPGDGSPWYFAVHHNKLYMLRSYQRIYKSHWITDSMAIANGKFLHFQEQDISLLLCALINQPDEVCQDTTALGDTGCKLGAHDS